MPHTDPIVRREYFKAYCGRVTDAQALASISSDAKARERFWSKVDKSGDCWLWQGSRLPHGYGRFALLGRMILAHRVSYVIAHGPLALEIVRHGCDNPPCVNPKHLFNGTQSDNVQDMIRKGRLVIGDHAGERHGRAKLTWATVEEIRSACAVGASMRSMARKYGVALPTISRIVKGTGWVCK